MSKAKCVTDVMKNKKGVNDEKSIDVGFKLSYILKMKKTQKYQIKMKS